MAKSTGTKTARNGMKVETLKQKQRWVNIPTEELCGFDADEKMTPKMVTYSL
jgi:hypothetical protein